MTHFSPGDPCAHRGVRDPFGAAETSRSPGPWAFPPGTWVEESQGQGAETECCTDDMTGEGAEGASPSSLCKKGGKKEGMKRKQREKWGQTSGTIKYVRELKIFYPSSR